MPGYVPYRGEGPYPRTPKRRYVPTPDDKELARSGGCAAVGIGLCLVYFAVTDKTTRMVYVLLIYLLFWVIAFFATRDAKKIKTITPDVDGRNHEPHDSDSFFDRLERSYEFIGAQKLKDRRGAVLRKHRVNEPGRKMSRHGRK
ncbi:MAG: hypothetical protein WA821_20015 [Anaerolineales bacterium]